VIFIKSTIPSSDFTLFRYPRKEDAMKNPLFLLTAAALGAGVALTGTVVAQDHSRRADASANQISDQVDARIARIRADLRLTPEQEKNWAGFESAMRDIGKKQADREITRRADRAQQQGPVDIVEQMRRGANSMSERSVEQKTLANAAQPLFASLNDQQKRRLTEELVHMINERDVN
jgi:hypothetical protein